MSKKYDYKHVNQVALSSIDRVLSYYLPGGKTKGKEYTVRNPTRADEKPGSFSINTDSGVWGDFATDDRGGDVISLISYIQGIEQGAAHNELTTFLGIDVGSPIQPPTKKPTKKKAVLWEPILPVPNDALKSCPTSHYSSGKPSTTWQYLDGKKQLLMKIMRFDSIDGGKRVKDYRPLIYAENSATHAKEWRWQQMPDNRPLYGLDSLATNPSKMVLLVEGEKAADAAKSLFPSYVCMTWPGGSKALKKVNFKPLAGRTILLWPDNDQAGIKAMQEVSKILNNIDAHKVRTLDLSIFKLKPSGSPVKPILSPGATWANKADAHDACASGWTHEHIKFIEKKRGSLHQQPPKKTEASEFLVKDDGVYYRVPKDDPNDDAPPTLTRVCDRLDVLGQTRDKHSAGWGVLVTFKDPDNKTKELNIPFSYLVTDGGTEAVRGLSDLGLKTAPGTTAKRRLIKYMQLTESDERVILVNKLGWFDDVFLLPDETIGNPKERLWFNNVGGAVSKIKQQGTLEEWQEHISKKCLSSHRLIFAISSAFAAPLLELTGSETAGFHFHGTSSTGKSTAQFVAASVYGDRDYKKTWRTTDNALEATAAYHSDCLLILDEIGECEARIIGATVYMLGNGEGKSRANVSGGSNNNTAKWRLIFLSSGEHTLAVHMAEAGQTIKAGMEMRMLSIQADAGKGAGIFDTVQGFSGGAALAEHLDEKTRQYYGTPFKEFLNKLLASGLHPKLPERIKKAKLQFAQENLTSLASGQDRRAADKFALVGIAGELATHYGITGWPKGAANEAAKVCFNSWQEYRGGEGRLEDKQIIQQIALFFENNGESRFTRWDSEEPRVDEHVPRTDKRCGFRKTEIKFPHGRDESTETVYFVLPESFKQEICKGLNMKDVIRILHALGALERSTDGKNSIPIRLPGYGSKKQRCYKIIPGNLNADNNEDKPLSTTE